MGLGGQREVEVGQGPEGRWVSAHTLMSHLCLTLRKLKGKARISP